MPHTTKSYKIQLHEAVTENASLRAEIAMLHKLLAEARKERVQSGAYPTGDKIIAGFGRDWSRGFRNPILSISPQDVFPAEQQETQVA